MVLSVSVVTTVFAGLCFGLALAAPPGPMNAIIAEESVLRGWTSGFAAGLGAVTADVVFFLLAVAGVVTVVEQIPTLRGVMVGIGGFLMLYFAYGAAKGAQEPFRPDAETAASDSRGFRKAFALALTNPYQVLFWLTVGVGLLQPGQLDVLAALPVVGDRLAGQFLVATGSPALLVSFFLGIGLWITGFPAALVAGERRTETLAPVVSAGSAVALAGFGVFFLFDAVNTLV